MGPLWIVMGLVPGRPLGFEKWLRIIFANLAVFPLVAFLIVFARVLVDSGGTTPLVLGAATSAGSHGGVLAAATQQSTFYPPLTGNPNIKSVSVLAALGAILMLPAIPGILKDLLKATGQGGKAAMGSFVGGLAAGAGAATAFPKNVLRRWNSVDEHGAPKGAVAVMKQRLIQKTPFGRRAIGNKKAMHDINYYHQGDTSTLKRRAKWYSKKKNRGLEAGAYDRIGPGRPPRRGTDEYYD